MAVEDWLTQEQRDASMLPSVTEKGGLTQTITVCDMMSGGADEIDGMPRRLSLIRWTVDGSELRADYVQVVK